MREGLLLPFANKGNGGSKRFNNLPKITHLIGGLSWIQIARNLSVTTIEADSLLRCKNVEMTRMGENANLIIWTCLTAQILWAIYFPEGNLFITETIFRVFKCLLSTVSDIPHYAPLLRSLRLCVFPSLGHTCLSSLQAFANAVTLCGMAIAFQVLKKSQWQKTFSNPSMPTSNITSFKRSSTIIPAKNALCSPSHLGPSHFCSLSMHPALTPVSCSLLALCPSLYPVEQVCRETQLLAFTNCTSADKWLTHSALQCFHL